MAMAAIVVQRIRCALVGEMTRDMDDAHRLYSPEDAHYSLLSLTLNQSIIRTPTLAQAGVPQHYGNEDFDGEKDSFSTAKSEENYMQFFSGQYTPYWPHYILPPGHSPASQGLSPSQDQKHHILENLILRDMISNKLLCRDLIYTIFRPVYI